MTRTLRPDFAATALALTASMFLAPRTGAQDPAEAVTLRYHFAAGDRWSFDEEMTLQLTFKVLANGEVAQTIDQKNHKVRKGDVSVLAAAGEKLEVVRARFAPECSDTEKTGDAEPQKKPTALAGATVTVRRRAQGDAEVECATALSDDEKKEARELIDPTEGFLPKKPIKVGDRWVADEKAIARALELGPDDRGTLRLRLKALRNVEGRRTAEVEAALVANQKQDFMTITSDLEGSILIDIESGMAVGVDLHGPLTVSGETEQEDAGGKPAKVTVEGGGELKYRSGARRLPAEKEGAPATVPAPATPEPATAPAAPLRASGGLPFRVPEGWEGQKQEGMFVMTPKGLDAGKIYTVVVPDLTTKVGSVRGLLDAGKASLAEAGTFTPSADPARGRNHQGWEYDVIMGPLEKDGKAVLAQVMGLKKGEDEGIIIVMSDSVETMTKYSDAFTAMIHSLGASVSARPAAAGPAAVPAAAAGRAVDLKYQVPEGWTAKQMEGAVLIEKAEHTFYENYTHRLLILPSEPLKDTLKKTFLANWAALVAPQLVETRTVPFPFMRRLKSGAVCAYDADTDAKTKSNEVTAGLLLVARGTRCVPILCFFFGGTLGDKLDNDMNVFIESAEIPGAGSEKIALFSAAEMVGDWSESSASYASYVTPSGGYAGDASIATASSISLRADDTFQRSFLGVGRGAVVKEKDAGTWKLEDQRLVQTGKDEQSNWVLAVGSDAKAGSFLVLSYGEPEMKPKLCNPRGAFQGLWYKRKE